MPRWPIVLAALAGLLSGCVHVEKQSPYSSPPCSTSGPDCGPIQPECRRGLLIDDVFRPVPLASVASSRGWHESTTAGGEFCLPPQGQVGVLTFTKTGYIPVQCEYSRGQDCREPQMQRA